jgi:hypothetical protein
MITCLNTYGNSFKFECFYLSTVSYFILKNSPSPILLKGIFFKSLREPSNVCTSGTIRLEVSPCLLCGGYHIDTKATME